MCATCVAQGAAYVGVSLGALRVMGARAATRRAKEHPGAAASDVAVDTVDAEAPTARLSFTSDP